MTTVTIYDADGVGTIESRYSDLAEAFVGVPVVFKTNAGVFWTQKNGGPGDEPTDLIVNTMSRQFVFKAPKLVRCSNSCMLISALSEHGASGTLQMVKKFFILIDNSYER